MTSEERRAARYKRRVDKRKAKLAEYNAPFDTFDTITDMNHLIDAAYKSRKGVGKKASVQKYMMNLISYTSQSWSKLKNGEDVRQGFIEFDIHERGKARHIKAMHMRERVIQRCLCDYALVPVLRRGLVYDNGASMKGKGIHFALSRIKRMLQKHVRKYGTRGYILMVDFSGYFDNIQHEAVWKLLDKSFADERIKKLAWSFIKAFGDISLGIGSQVSQIIAVAYPGRVDHYIKEVHKIGQSARYMDDTYAISNEREPLERLLSDCKKMWAALGIQLNESKTRIIPIRRFTFMKVRFRITDSGKVLMLPCRRSFSRMRRKLISFKRFVDAGKMTMEQVNTSYQSWRGYQKHFNAHKPIRRMDEYYTTIFGMTPGRGVRTCTAIA